MRLESNSEANTIDLGKEFASKLSVGDVVCLEGDLGAGKTHFIKGIAEGLGIDASKVSSPTFNIVNEYTGEIPLYHFDCYRIEREEEMQEIGFDDYLFGDGISVIEWPSKISGLIPENAIKINMEHAGKSKRIIFIL